MVIQHDSPHLRAKGQLNDVQLWPEACCAADALGLQVVAVVTALGHLGVGVGAPHEAAALRACTIHRISDL